MNWPFLLLWGLISTLILTTVLSAAQGLGLTRMSLLFMLGTLFTSDRDLAKLIGFAVHLVNGWWIALVYVAVFQSLGVANWWIGAGMGLVHACFVLVTVLPLLPGLHPRMATEQRGPTPTRELEPPGFLALHYGRGTPMAVVVSHIIYGAVLGVGYRLA